MEVMESPYKRAADSPSRQLLWELSRLAVTEQENFYAYLDETAIKQEAAHERALAIAAAEHDRVRRNAEVEREKLELQIEQERQRRENEQRRELERQRQEKAEWEIAEKRKEIERVKAQELKERQEAEKRKVEVAEAERHRLEKEKQEGETAKKFAEEKVAERRAAEAQREKAEGEAAEKTRAQPAMTTMQVGGQTLTGVQSAREGEHYRYLEIHQKLKELRKWLSSETSRDSNLKKRMGTMRRNIKKFVSQLGVGQGVNKIPLAGILGVLKEAATVSEPTVDISPFLTSTVNTSDSTFGPALLVYQLNIFSKAIVSQFIVEAGVSPKTADPVGVVASQIFSNNDFKLQGKVSLIDILIAKLHVVCPVLFGIYGNDKTTQGKIRLGWWREDQGGPFIPEGRHSERMTGLGAGFAAISLRNYEKVRNENPYPNHHFWHAMANIVNVPSNEATNTHFVVLKAMIENNEARILEFFGNAGVVALRKALVEFPSHAAASSVAAKALGVLADVLKRNKKLYL